MNDTIQSTPSRLGQAPSSPLKELAYQFFLGTLFFFLLCLSVNDTIKETSLLMILTTLGLGLVKQNTLIPRFSYPMIPLLAWVSLSGISVFYALAKKFALREFLGLFMPFCLIFLLLILCKNTRRLTAVLVIGSSWISFLSIDLLSTRIFFSGFQSIIGHFTQAYENVTGLEVGVRMTSLLVNPNVYAGCTGIAVLLALGLVLDCDDKQARTLYLPCLFINALGFILSFSLGATATIILGFLAYLLWEEKKLPLFLLMVETLILSVAAAFPIFLSSFTKWEEVNWVPLIATLMGAILLVGLDATVGKKLLDYFQGKATQSKLFFVFVVGGLCLYALCAVTITKPYTLSAGETLKRSAYPEAGEYSLQVETTENLTITIQSQNREQTMMHTNTVIYRGSSEDISFTVPEDSEVVHFFFKAEQETTLDSALLSDGTALSLHYPLLPGFIVNRLQGLWANQNAIQRTVFFEDGMKLFSQNPLFGLGMGSFESALFTVQSFYYETAYVHNHYIQMLLETGILGLLCFVATLLAFFMALWQGKQAPQRAASLAVLVFVSTHALTELIWSSSFYLLLAYSAFAVMFCQLDDLALSPVEGKKSSKLQNAQDMNASTEELPLWMAEQPASTDHEPSHEAPVEVLSLDTEEPSPLASTHSTSSVSSVHFADMENTENSDENLDENFIEILEEGDPLDTLSFQEAPPPVHTSMDTMKEEIQREIVHDLSHEDAPWREKPLTLWLFRWTVVGMCLFSMFLYGNIKARSLVTSSTGADFLPAVVKATKMDVFETQDYWVTYLDAIHNVEDPAVHVLAEEYIEKLEQISSNSIPLFIARYYLSQNQIPQAVDALVDYVSYVISKSEYWNLAYRTLLVEFSNETALDIVEGIQRLEEIRETWNAENMGTITLASDVREIVAILQEELS